MKDLLILGAGTGGTIMANHLARRLPAAWRITVVDRDGDHLYQPGLLFVPFGMNDPADLVKPRHRWLPERARLVLGEIDRIDPDTKAVRLTDGTPLPYDILIVATGTRLDHAATPGLLGPGWWSTWSTCRSSARWPRWSSCCSPTPTSPTAACATTCS